MYCRMGFIVEYMQEIGTTVQEKSNDQMGVVMSKISWQSLSYSSKQLGDFSCTVLVLYCTRTVLYSYSYTVLVLVLYSKKGKKKICLSNDEISANDTKLADPDSVGSGSVLGSLGSKSGSDHAETLNVFSQWSCNKKCLKQFLTKRLVIINLISLQKVCFLEWKLDFYNWEICIWVWIRTVRFEKSDLKKRPWRSGIMFLRQEFQLDGWQSQLTWRSAGQVRQLGTRAEKKVIIQ